MARKGRLDLVKDNKHLKQAVLNAVKANKPGEFISEMESIIGQRYGLASNVRFVYLTGVDRNTGGARPWFRKFVTDTPDTGELTVFLLGYDLIYAQTKEKQKNKAKFVVSVVNEFCDMNATKIKV